MAQTFKFQAQGRYYKRRSAKVLKVWDGGTDEEGLPVLSAEKVPALVTRWGWQTSRYRRPHDAYVTPDGVWRECKNVAVHLGEDGKPDAWDHVLAPIADRWIEDRHRAQTAEKGDAPVCRVHVVAGRVVSVVTCGGGTLPEGLELHDPETPDATADLLNVA